MTSYLDGSPSTITFPLVYEDGSPIDASSISYTLFDKDDVVLIPSTVIASSAIYDPTISVTIPGTNNALAVGEVSSVRRISLSTTTSDGTLVVLDQYYVIHGSNQLSFMVNSYQTVQEAELVAFNVPNLTAFESATVSEKVKALKEAYVRMGRMTYLVDYNYLGATLNYVTEVNTMTSGPNPLTNLGQRSVVVNKINLLPMGYVKQLPAVFMAQLKVAQVIEADFILAGDIESDDRTSGVVSKKVGESTTMWKQSKVLTLPICKRALESLRGHIYYGSVIGRG